MSICSIDDVVKDVMKILNEVVTEEYPDASEEKKEKIKANILNAFSRQCFYSGPRKEH